MEFGRSFDSSDLSHIVALEECFPAGAGPDPFIIPGPFLNHLRSPHTAGWVEYVRNLPVHRSVTISTPSLKWSAKRSITRSEPAATCSGGNANKRGSAIGGCPAELRPQTGLISAHSSGGVLREPILFCLLRNRCS